MENNEVEIVDGGDMELINKGNAFLDKSNETISSGKELVDSTNDVILSGKDLINSANEMLDKVENIAKSATRIKEIRSETYLKAKRIDDEHKQVMTNMESHYKQQDRALNSTDKVIDTGLKTGDIEMVKVGLTGMLGTIQNKFSSDKLSEIESKLIVDDDEDDIDGI